MKKPGKPHQKKNYQKKILENSTGKSLWGKETFEEKNPARKKSSINPGKNYVEKETVGK